MAELSDALLWDMGCCSLATNISHCSFWHLRFVISTLFEQLEQHSPEEERILELERELQDYKNSRSKLEFGFDNDQELTTTVICPAQGDDTLKAEVLSKVFTDEYVHRQFIEQQQHIERIINQSRGRAPEYQFQKYIKACETYLKELEPAPAEWAALQQDD